MREPLRSASRRQSASGAGRERESGRVEHADGNRPATLEVNNKLQQAADALQQQVDEYLASFDPEKPLYQDGGDAGQLPAKAMVDPEPLVYRVLGEWYMDAECRSLRVSLAMHAVRTCKCQFFCCGANRH